MQKTQLRFFGVLILSHWLMNVVDGAQTVVFRADERQLYLILANGSWQTSVPARVELLGFGPNSVAGVVLSHSDPDASPFLDHREELVRELSVEVQGQELIMLLPPSSVAFITVQR